MTTKWLVGMLWSYLDISNFENRFNSFK